MFGVEDGTRRVATREGAGGHVPPSSPSPTLISEPNKFHQFQFQTSEILFFVGFQKLHGPKISRFLPCTLQSCFYIQYHWGIREITSVPVKIICFILCYILLTRWRNIKLFNTIFALTIQKSPDLNLTFFLINVDLKVHLLSGFFSRNWFCSQFLPITGN